MIAVPVRLLVVIATLLVLMLLVLMLMLLVTEWMRFRVCIHWSVSAGIGLADVSIHEVAAGWDVGFVRSIDFCVFDPLQHGLVPRHLFVAFMQRVVFVLVHEMGIIKRRDPANCTSSMQPLPQSLPVGQLRLFRSFPLITEVSIL